MSQLALSVSTRQDLVRQWVIKVRTDVDLAAGRTGNTLPPDWRQFGNWLAILRDDDLVPIEGLIN